MGLPLTAWMLIALGAACGGLLMAVAGLRVELRRLRENSASELEQLRAELSGLAQGRDDLERLSSTDPLTGVGNLRYLQDILAREVERADRYGRPLAVLMLDIDHFREVNEAYGHQRGSVVLRELAQRIALEVRAMDGFARYGGEEFVLVLPETGAEGAAKVAERICYVVRKHVFDEAGRISPDESPIRVTISVGAAVQPLHGAHATTLLRRADEALAAAKRAGCDSWRMALEPAT